MISYFYLGIVFCVAFVIFSSASVVLIYKDMVKGKKDDGRKGKI